jgi:hypothetical protein
LLPNGATAERLKVVRSIDHGSLERVCRWISNPAGAPEHVRDIVKELGSTVGILNVALAFPDLLQARREADYDHFAGFSKPAALQYIDAAESAIRDMRYQKKAKKEVFYALLAMEIKKVR